MIRRAMLLFTIMMIGAGKGCDFGWGGLIGPAPAHAGFFEDLCRKYYPPDPCPAPTEAQCRELFPCPQPKPFPPRPDCPDKPDPPGGGGIPPGVLTAPPAKCGEKGAIVVDEDKGSCNGWNSVLAGRGWEPHSWPGMLAGHSHYVTRYGNEPEDGTERATFSGPRVTGRSTVWAGYMATENRARKVFYEITHSQGKATVTLNQNEQRPSAGPRWARLGVWSGVVKVELIPGPDHSESIDGIAVVPEVK